MLDELLVTLLQHYFTELDSFYWVVKNFLKEQNLFTLTRVTPQHIKFCLPLVSFLTLSRFLSAGKFSYVLQTLNIRLSLYCYFNDANYVKFIHALYLKCLLHPTENYFSKEMIKCQLCPNLKYKKMCYKSMFKTNYKFSSRESIKVLLTTLKRF